MALIAKHKMYDKPFPTTFLKDKNSRWRIISCLQKAIRRGEVETAVNMANALYDAEPSYTRYRLTVIALEDVGAGNPELMEGWLLYASQKDARADFTDSENKSIVLNYVKEMAESIHDRNACDLLVCADWHPDYAGMREWAFAEDTELDDVFDMAVTSADPIAQTLCLWRLVGTERFKSPVLPQRPGSINNLLHAYEKLGLSQDNLDAVRLGALYQREGHPIALGITLLPQQDKWAYDLKGKSDDLIDLGMIGGKFLSSTFDMHTAEGKRAFAYFRKAHEPLGKWLVDHNLTEWDQFVSVVGAAVFRLEGHQVSNRLISPHGDWIQEKTEQAFATSAGNTTVEQGMEVREIIKEGLPILHKARRRIVE